MTLRGLTWDHPRAYRPLEAFAVRHPELAVSWDRQSLADFEARPIADLARSYDLMIIDHPGLGAAIAAGALQPLGQLVPADRLADWRAGSAGPTWASYTVAGQQWAVPVDVATQVSVFRPDVLGAAPRDWAGVPAVARRQPTALCLGGPHAFLTLLAMCAPARPAAPGGPLLHPGHAAAAIGLLRAVWPAADQDISAADPVAVHEALAAGTVAYCPLAYGYASYARPEPGRHALAWADAPTFGSARPGTVLGGTGLAVSAPRRPDPAEVLRFLTTFLAPEVQAGLVPAQAGQPAAAAAWASASVDQAWGRYYSSTRRSLDAAWVRPRTDGWILLQDEASGLVRAAITGKASAPEIITLINARYRELTRREPAEAGST
ncbi:MAG TPA: extracellular solute-binding protein [Streptosporangiaceae bacterium]|nr:extracellular solute-binding protein [Streptosporangiaceae bacterium]